MWLSTISVVRDGAEAGESEQSEAAVFMQMLCDGGTSNIFEPTASQDSSVSINTLHVIGNRGAKTDEKTGIRRMKRRLNTPQKNRVTDLGGVGGLNAECHKASWMMCRGSSGGGCREDRTGGGL